MIEICCGLLCHEKISFRTCEMRFAREMRLRHVKRLRAWGSVSFHIVTAGNDVSQRQQPYISFYHSDIFFGSAIQESKMHPKDASCFLYIFEDPYYN